jgi:hypothetical protein
MNRKPASAKIRNSLRKKSAGKMYLVFRRTGKRRYAVEAHREQWPDLEMDPAPGFHSLMPHDLMHLVVEAQLGLENGIFGQLAIGGDAGSFRPIAVEQLSSRATARLRRHQQARGKPLLRAGRTECAQSERATYLCHYEWTRRSGKLSDKDSLSMSRQSNQIRNISPTNEMDALDEKSFQSICRHLDELSSVWSGLEVGESMSVSWPELSVSKLTVG